MKKYQRGFIQGIADSIADSFIKLLIFAFALGTAFGVFMTTGVPVIWEWIKPIIHGWTA